MGRSNAQEFADAAAMFDLIPTAAEQELVVELGIIARDLLAIQRQHVPVDTGALDGALAAVVLVDQLRARIGLINAKLAPFYGRFVEFGRWAHTVWVERRRRVDGMLRLSRGRKRAADIATAYSLHVAPRAPHPFVNPPDVDLEAIAATRLADFWANTLSRAGVTR